MKKMQYRVYESYAFTKNEKEKMLINREIYNELKTEYKILKISDVDHRMPTKEELEKNDIVYSRKACYGHGEYKIYKCPETVQLDELALICDDGNLCFGYSGSRNKITVFED
ncbi:MAG: hypothetical protein IKM97_04820 [Clostridia bacterium]|nr:hypothetical protein [Clostridia bacterium]